MSNHKEIYYDPDMDYIAGRTKDGHSHADVRLFDVLELKEPEQTAQTISPIEAHVRVDDQSILCNTGQLHILYEIAKGLHSTSFGHIFEFGTHQGGTAAILGCAVRDSVNPYGPVITIDCRFIFPDESHIYTTGKIHNMRASDINKYAKCYIKTWETIHGLGLDEWVATVTFHDLAFFGSVLQNLPIQLVFHDSSAEEKHVSQFLQMVFPCVEVGGWIAIHDYNIIQGDDIQVVAPVNNWLNDMQDRVKPYKIRTDSIILMQKLKG